jgi:hypothetical protein
MTRLRRPREYVFSPRIINPVRLKRAVLLSAEAEIREAQDVLRERLPWLETEVFHDPLSVQRAASDEATVFLLDDTALLLLDERRLRAQNKDAVLVLLSYQPFIHCSPPQAAARKYPYTAKADLVFAVGGAEFAPRVILPYVIRAAEDRLNVMKYARARRYIFHIVDDEPRWFSQFLPVLYPIIGLRADVTITRTFEESLRFLFGVENEADIRPDDFQSRGHGDDVVCLITDLYIPKGRELLTPAGRDLIRLVNTHYPRIPVIIASKAPEALELKDLGFILPKGDPGSLARLKDYILNVTCLGDFLVYDDTGREVRRAKNLPDICRILDEAGRETPEGRHLREILESYGEKDKFSTWLYMHSYRELGDRLRPRRDRGRQLLATLRRRFQVEMARMEMTPLVIAGQKIFTLPDLARALRTLDPERVQPYSDDDAISSWLDRKGYPELAEELRPIHGSGPGLSRKVLRVVEKWIKAYGLRP